MRKLYLILLLLISLKVLAQDQDDIEKCGFKIDLNGTDPATLRLEEMQLQQKIKELNKASETSKSKATKVYQIPIVVHIVHQGEAIGTGLNLSEDVVINYVKRLNLYYRYLNGDKSFDERYGVDCNIEFVLAVRDPDGNCTNGIKRYDYSNRPEYITDGIGSKGVSNGEIRSTLQWDTKKYYNVYLAKLLEVNGFAFTPGSGADGAFINGTLAYVSYNKTIAHEIGHGLGLYHTFEGGDDGTLKCPSLDPKAGDRCEDTPPHLGIDPCSKDKDEDINLCAETYVDSRTGVLLKSNKYFINNIMSYSSNSCKFMFTQDQANRMAGVLETTRKGLLAENGNLSLVPVQQPEVDFVADKMVICSNNNTVNLKDISACIPNTFLADSQYPGISFLWTIKNGTTTQSSTMRNPAFDLTKTGAYDVTLAITTPLGTVTKTKSKFITVGEVGTPVSCKFGAYKSGNYSTTLSKVEFAAMQNTTSEILNAQYTDFKCSKAAEIQAGKSYELKTTISASASNNSYVKAWIDYNNDGLFDKREVVFAGKLSKGETETIRTVLSHTILIPDEVVTNKILTMRIIYRSVSLDTDPYADTAISDSGCYSNSTNFFDVEDYGVIIRSGSLGLDDFENGMTPFVVYKNGDSFRVEAYTMLLKEIYIYDTPGKLLFHSDKINSTHYDLPVLNNQQLYIVKIKDTNGKVYTKKIIN